MISSTSFVGSHYCFFIIWWESWEECSALGGISFLRISLSKSAVVCCVAPAARPHPAPNHHCAPNHLSEDQLIMSENNLCCGWNAFWSGCGQIPFYQLKFFSLWWTRDAFFSFAFFCFAQFAELMFPAAACEPNILSSSSIVLNEMHWACEKLNYLHLLSFCFSPWGANAPK